MVLYWLALIGYGVRIASHCGTIVLVVTKAKYAC